MNKFAGMPFEKCWNCKHMKCKVQAVNDPDSKVKQGTYYVCAKDDETLDVSWKKCAGSKFESNSLDEQGEKEEAMKNTFNPQRRGQQVRTACQSL